MLLESSIMRVFLPSVVIVGLSLSESGRTRWVREFHAYEAAYNTIQLHLRYCATIYFLRGGYCCCSCCCLSMGFHILTRALIIQ